MRLNAVLSNREHPEYGVFTESFPVSRVSYDDNIEMIRQLEIGDAVAQDCHVDEITGDWPALKLMEHTQVNFDELDYLAKRLDSFDQYEKAQFQGMAAKLEIHDVRELINLTFCCQDATVITDFSELDIAGRRHYMTLNGGGASPDELKKLDARAFAEELIDYNIGYVTHFGVVYPNGMEMSELYDGRHFPEYRYEDCVMELEMSSRHNPADSPATYIYLPMTQVQIERAMLRAGVDSYADMRLRFLESELPDAIDIALDMEHESIGDINEMCSAIQALSREGRAKLGVVVSFAQPEYASQIKHLAENLELFDFAPGVQTPEDYGRYMIQESGHFD
ncbi:MAG: hypothetical protein PHG73_00005, partial [Pygmaiobacter sp.]|nr:hypothetical protein [Pygmaiobacter sp.]